MPLQMRQEKALIRLILRQVHPASCKNEPGRMQSIDGGADDVRYRVGKRGAEHLVDERMHWTEMRLEFDRNL